MPIGAEQLDDLLRDIQLPPPPQIVHALMRVAGDPDSSAKDVAAVIAVEPMLSARLLKVANSSYFGQVREVTTVERATIVLGLNYVRAIGLAVQLSLPFSRLDAVGMDMQAFWRDCLLRACVARQVAKRADAAIADQAFLIGLTQDLAIPALAVRHGVDYIEAQRRFQSTQHELDAWERTNLGYTHAEAAEAILDSWNLPKELTVPIGRHHGPSEEDPEGHSEPAAIEKLCVMSRFVGLLPLGATGSDSGDDVCEAALASLDRVLGVDVPAVADILRHAQSEFETIRAIFDERLPDQCAVGSILSQACARLGKVDPKLFEVAFS